MTIKAILKDENVSDNITKVYVRNNKVKVVLKSGMRGYGGNVVGPSSAVTNNFPSFADTTGKLLKDSGVSKALLDTLYDANGAAQSALTGANAYTDEQVENVTELLTEHVEETTDAHGGITEEAPNNGNAYLRKNKAWSEVRSVLDSVYDAIGAADNALTGANAYSDAKYQQALDYTDVSVSGANNYTDGKYQQSLNYTDVAVSGANNYTDGKYQQSLDYTDVSVSGANNYTDLKYQQALNYTDHAVSGLVTEAPVDSKQYARINAGWQEVTSGLSSVAVPLVLDGTVVHLGTAVAPTTPDANADVIWGASAIGKKGLVLQCIASQTANLFCAQASDGTPYTPIPPFAGSGARNILLGNTTANVPAQASAWSAGASYIRNALVVPTVANGFFYTATGVGVSGGVEPTWPVVVGGTVVDNTVTWRCKGKLTSGTDNVLIGDSVFTVAQSTSGAVAIGSFVRADSGLVAIGYRACKFGDVGNSVVIGYQAMENAASSWENVAIGYNALRACPNVNGHVAIGYTALAAYTGAGNEYNIAIGHSAMALGVAYGGRNIAIGYQAMLGGASTTSACDGNIAIGQTAGKVITTGANNVMIGYAAAFALNTGSSNVLIGLNAAVALTSGSSNTIIGKDAGKALTTESNNTIVGKQAHQSGTGATNTFIGNECGFYVNGNQNTAVGFAALGKQSGAISNTSVVAIGYECAKNTATTDSVFIGDTAGYSVSGARCIGIGKQALAGSSSTGADNVLIGYRVGYASAVTGASNTLIGNYCGTGLTSGTQNTTLGYKAGTALTDGQDNTCIGYQAGKALVSALSSIYIGSNAGASATGSRCTVIGTSAGATNTNGADIILIGKSSDVISTNSIQCVGIGNNSKTGVDSVSLGYNAGNAGLAGFANNVVIGSGVAAALTTGTDNVVIGKGANTAATTVGAIVLGSGALGASNTFVAGSSTYPTNTVYFGKGISNATPTDVTISGTAGSGNVAGAGLILSGGAGGAAGYAGGSVSFKTACVQTGGTTLLTRGTWKPCGALEFTGITTANQPTLSASGNGALYFDASVNRLLISRNAEAYVAIGQLPVVASGSSPSALESPSVYTNELVGSKATYTLPTAAAGLEFNFVVQDAFGLRVTANTGDTIRMGDDVTPAAGYIESTEVGSTVRLRAINATEWIAEAPTGIWDIQIS